MQATHVHFVMAETKIRHFKQPTACVFLKAALLSEIQASYEAKIKRRLGHAADGPIQRSLEQPEHNR